VDVVRLGGVFCAVRVRGSLRQVDVAERTGVSISTISRIERGRVTTLSIGTLARVAAALEMRIDIVARWRGGELDRLLSSGHSAMHEQVAKLLAALPRWTSSPEVTFAVYGERGVIDILAFHPERRALLVIELKTELADVQALLGQVDRYRRLAGRIALERGWDAGIVGVWVVMRDTTTNRRRVARHATTIHAALPDGVVRVRRWLKDPIGPLAAITFLADSHPRKIGRAAAGVKRVHRRSVRAG
jgi:transcriptional regulator with XRE-family HTH domain